MQTLSHKRLAWIDLQNPSELDIEFLRKEHHIHENPLRDIVRETAAPKIERYEGQLYLVLYFPVFNYEKRTTEGKELDLILTKDLLITVHHESLLPLEEFHRSCETEPDMLYDVFGDTTTYLLFTVLSNLYDNSLKQLKHIKQNIDSIDNDLFLDRKDSVVARILETRRDILNFRRTLAPQRQILESLASRGLDLTSKKSREAFDDVIEAYNRVWSFLESHKEAIEAIHETNDSLLNAKQNDTLRTLTVLSVITFYLTLVAAIFSTDAVYKPIIGSRYDFWWIAAIMGIVLMGLLFFFKRKRWM